jgi:Amt family ammonium transporter
MNRNLVKPALAASILLLLAMGPALAQEAAEAAPAADTAYIFNTLLFLVGGFLVMWMAAGFAMLEAGLVRSKNVSMQSLKNIALYSVAGIMYWLIGYNLMYDGVDGGVIGSFSPKVFPEAGSDLGDGYAASSDWFFQMVFCATTASIVSGALAERIKLSPFLVFIVVLTGLIYPITGAWQWGEGWLYELGFSDFAGSTLVHSVGGWAALTGAIILGARHGKYNKDGTINVMPGSSIPLATLGVFILWLGWFGFNGASQLAMGTIEDVASVGQIFANTNIAAAAGVVAVIVLTRIFYRKIDVTMVLNGAIGGLVAITAEPLTPSLWMAAVIGAIGGAIIVVFVPLLDRLKIDDVVGAIPAHLIAGIWGTIAVPLTNDGTNFGDQLVGILSIGAFVVITSSIVWFAIKAVIGLRPTVEEEIAGMDTVEVGVEAYPEFGIGGSRS